MNDKMLVFFGAAFAAFALMAAPGKADPVAEGYPDWQGLVEKNHIRGREICASDLRQRAVVVFETDVNSPALAQQLLSSAQLVALTGLAGAAHGVNWEDRELPRDFILVHVVHGGVKGEEQLAAALKPPKDVDESKATMYQTLNGAFVPYYDNITFTGAPDTTGKLPYVYVLGAAGKEIVFQGAADTAGLRSAMTAAKKEVAKVKAVEWKPFYGSVNEPQFFAKEMAKAVEKGKIALTAKAILKGVTDKNADKAKEAQILYDAINQFRSDLVMRIKMEAYACPHRAYYDIRQLLKYWPSEKKKIEAQMQRINQIPGAMALCKMFAQVLEWANPSFTPKNASDAKSIVANMNKMKKQLAVMRESKVMVVQNGALLLDSQLDQLISEMPSRVPAK